MSERGSYVIMTEGQVIKYFDNATKEFVMQKALEMKNASVKNGMPESIEVEVWKKKGSF